MSFYGRVPHDLFTGPESGEWSERAKYLATYLLASKHINMIGCMHLPLGYVMADLSWDEATATAYFNELVERRFIARDQRTGWTFIRNYLRDFPITNPNHVKAVATLIGVLPTKIALYADFLGQIPEDLRVLLKEKAELDVDALMNAWRSDVVSQADAKVDAASTASKRNLGTITDAVPTPSRRHPDAIPNAVPTTRDLDGDGDGDGGRDGDGNGAASLRAPARESDEALLELPPFLDRRRVKPKPTTGNGVTDD